MDRQPLAVVRFGDFTGQVSSIDPHDLPKGAMVSQINMTCEIAGQLACRKGTRPISFDNGITSTSAEVIGVTYFRRPEADWIIYQDTDGNIKAGRTPS